MSNQSWSTKLADVLKQLLPAIGLWILSYFKSREELAKNQKMESDLELQIEKEHSKIDRDNSNRDAGDIVDEFIKGD